MNEIEFLDEIDALVENVVITEIGNHLTDLHIPVCDETAELVEKYVPIRLETGIKGGSEVVQCKFSDLEETIDNIGNDWEDIGIFEIRDVPVYRDPQKFEYAVCKYVFNVIEKWQMDRDNAEYRQLIFGE